MVEVVARAVVVVVVAVLGVDLVFNQIIEDNGDAGRLGVFVTCELPGAVLALACVGAGRAKEHVTAAMTLSRRGRRGGGGG